MTLGHVLAIRNDLVISTETIAKDKERHTNKYLMTYFMHLYKKNTTPLLFEYIAKITVKRT